MTHPLTPVLEALRRISNMTDGCGPSDGETGNVYIAAKSGEIARTAITLLEQHIEREGWRDANAVNPVGSEGPYLCKVIGRDDAKYTAKPYQVAAWFGVWNVPGDLRVTHWKPITPPQEAASDNEHMRKNQ